MRSLKILVIGVFSDERTPEETLLAEELGKAVANRGHTLFNGCFNVFDEVVASAAMTEAKKKYDSARAKMAVQSFISDNNPAHRIGLLRNSRVKSWDPGQAGWSPPELISECDVVIGMGGDAATHRAFHLTRMSKKPILPITAFGGAAVEAYSTEYGRFDKMYGGRISKEEFSLLDMQFPENLGELARSVISLAEKIVVGNSIFVAMPFREALDETFDTIASVAECFDYGLTRTDREHTTGRIYPRIVGGIRNASLIIADVTYVTPNVYYELGFSEALEKDTIVIARTGTKLEFDLQDIPTIFYSNQVELKAKLCERVEGITGRKRSQKE